MAVQSFIIKPQNNPHKDDFFTGLVQTVSTPTRHISTVLLNTPERPLTTTYRVTPTSAVKENLLPIVKATRGGGQRKGEGQVFQNIQRHLQHTLNHLPPIKRYDPISSDFDPVSYVMEMKMT